MTDSNSIVTDNFEEHLRVMTDVLRDCMQEIRHGGDLICSGLQAGKKILLCGNGGSAADAQHIAAELVGR